MTVFRKGWTEATNEAEKEGNYAASRFFVWAVGEEAKHAARLKGFLKIKDASRK